VKISYFPKLARHRCGRPVARHPESDGGGATSHHVTLTYGTSPVNQLGDVATLVGLLALVGLVGWPKLRARRKADASPWDERRLCSLGPGRDGPGRAMAMGAQVEPNSRGGGSRSVWR